MLMSTSRAMILLILVSLAFLTVRCVNAITDPHNMEKDILNRILLRQYDPRIRPSSGGSKVVAIGITFEDIPSIDDKKMEYSARVFLQTRWTDERLKFDSGNEVKQLTLTQPNLIWVPDLSFVNERKSHSDTVVRIFPDGRVHCSIRASLTLSCQMKMQSYPFDRQVCPLIISSGQSADQVELQWMQMDPVRMATDISILNFKLQGHVCRNTSYATAEGEFQNLEVDLTFKRLPGYHMMQVYIPCMMLVIVSWLSFWIDLASAVTARTFLSVSTLLVMAVQTSALNTMLPAVPYTKAIDVWTGVCLTFVFAALVELVIAHRLCRTAAAADDCSVDSSDAPSNKTTAGSAPSGTARQGSQPLRFILSKLPVTSEKLDSASRVVFLVLFVVFNFIYWPTYVAN